MNSVEPIEGRLLDLLECPRDRAALILGNGHLRCANGHKYPIVNGVPVFLLAEKEQTIGIAKESLKATETGIGAPLYVDTIGISEEEKRGIERDWPKRGKIDPVISYLVGATSGFGYLNLIGQMENYPIPDIPLEDGNGRLLLDIGSNWGRWSVSAARKGWRVVGIEPQLGAIMASRRAFSDTGLDIAFICGDARFLPFKTETFSCVFSYGVIQHFSKSDAEIAIAEVGRVLRRGGAAKIQMAHKGGLRSRYWLSRPDYADGGPFRVRYWSLESLRDTFNKYVGPATLMAEGFGGLGLLAEDRKYVSTKAKVLISATVLLKKLSVFVGVLKRFADSVYVVATKP